MGELEQAAEGAAVQLDRRFDSLPEDHVLCGEHKRFHLGHDALSLLSTDTK